MNVEKEKIPLDLSPAFKAPAPKKHGQWFIGLMTRNLIFWGATVLVATALSKPHIYDYSSYEFGTPASYSLNMELAQFPNNQLQGTQGMNVFHNLAYSHSAFDRAIQSGDMIRMKILLKQNPALLNKSTQFGISPIALATIYDQSEMVQFFLDNGAKVNEQGWHDVPLVNLPLVNNVEETQRGNGTGQINPRLYDTKRALIEAGADVSFHDYALVRETLTLPGWPAFWKNYFSKNNKENVLKNIIAQAYPEFVSYNQDMQTLEGKSVKPLKNTQKVAAKEEPAGSPTLNELNPDTIPEAAYTNYRKLN